MLVRTRPYRPALSLHAFDRSLDRTFEQLTRSFATSSARTPVVDASWQDGDLVLTVDLPGVPAEHVNVTVAGRTLTLSATTEHSSWERSMSLSSALDPEQVTATHLDGRLTVKVAAAAKPAARTIEISTSAPAAIPASAETADEGSADSSAEDGEAPAQPENGTSETA